MPFVARLVRLALALLLVAGCASPSVSTIEAAPRPTECPAAVAAIARCLAGQDSAGAWYLIAMPNAWNGDLVLHAHGGPTLGPPDPKRTFDDLQRWAIVPRAGFAWAGTTFRQGGVAVMAAAEDTERLRRIFIAHVAVPRRTVLHGQSWGASVAARAAEADPVEPDGRRRYDAVLLTSGVLGGGTRSYDFRLDLRVVYEVLCANHPRPDEAPYPLWMGLPPGSALNPAELARRADECLGLRKPAAQRTPEQAARIRTLVDVIRIPERSIVGHLNWATWHFQDIVQKRTGGGNPFGNATVRYVGSPDDAALNAAVPRYRADPRAVAAFAADTDPTGRIPVPVLTIHAVDDPTAFVELESAFRATMERAGTADHLVQAFTAHAEHSYLADPVYPAALEALLAWVERGVKPTPADVAARCAALEARYGGGCRFLPDYRSGALETRVAPR
jgi:alpha-beta hydrolase superfamily lysophospholipase